MEDKIKQKIEKQSFIIYPIDLKGTGLDWNKALRDEWVKGAEYGYNIKENVNEKLVEALESVEKYLRNQDLSEIGMQVQGKVLEALLSASNQENNSGEKLEKNEIICDHPSNELENYHDSAVLCNKCGCIISQFGKDINTPHKL